MKTQSMSIREFLSGEHKVKQREQRRMRLIKMSKVAATAALPVATCGAVGTMGFTMRALAATNVVPAAATAAAVPATAKEWMSEQALSTLAHVLDPLVDIMVALSFPIASVIIVGSCFFFMFNQADRGFDTIMKAGLGYVLIQVSPLILNVLKQVGSAV